MAKRPLHGAALVAKKRKLEHQHEHDPVETMLQSISERLSTGLDKVPAQCTQMLSQMLASSLGVVREQRHRYQESVVDMVGAILKAKEEELAAQQAAIQAETHALGAKRVSREAAVQAAEKDLAAKREVANKKKYDLGSAAQAFKMAKEAVAAAQLAESIAEKDIQATTAKKGLLAAAFSDYVKPLAEGTVGQDDAARLVKSLMSVLAQFQLDESMMTALPSALTKEPSTRGPFDTTLVAQLDDAVSVRMANFTGKIRDATILQAKLAADLKASAAAFHVARLKQHAAADVFTKARSAQKDAEDALEAATQALKNLDPEEVALTEDLANAQDSLKVFLEEPKLFFQTLSHRVTPPATPEEPEEPVIDAGEV